MTSARHKDQLGLGPMEVRGSEQSHRALRNSEQAAEPLRNPEQLATDLLNAAFEAAHLENKEIAHLCDVSVSLVEKWRSREARGCPSFAQLLCLPPSFQLALFRQMNRQFGLGRAALADVLDAAGVLALVMER